MAGWVDGWTGGQMDRWMDAWTSILISRVVNINWLKCSSAIYFGSIWVCLCVYFLSMSVKPIFWVLYFFPLGLAFTNEVIVLVLLVMRKQTLHCYVYLSQYLFQKLRQHCSGSSLSVFLIIIELPGPFNWYMFLFITL